MPKGQQSPEEMLLRQLSFTVKCEGLTVCQRGFMIRGQFWAKLSVYYIHTDTHSNRVVALAQAANWGFNP